MTCSYADNKKTNDVILPATGAGLFGNFWWFLSPKITVLTSQLETQQKHSWRISASVQNNIQDKAKATKLGRDKEGKKQDSSIL